MQRKRILYILHDIQIGGVEVALLSAIPDLNRQFELKVIALGKIDSKITSTLTQGEKSCLCEFDYPLYQYPWVIFKLIRLIIRFNPAIMICSLWRASLVGTLVKMVRKDVQFFSFIHSTGFAHLFDRIFSVLAIRNSNRILTDSTATRDFLLATYKPRAAVHTISFIVKNSANVRAPTPLDLENIRIMFLGRINAVKNLPLTIDVIAFLKSKNLKVTLDIYGRNDGAENEVKAYISSKNLSDYIRFKGELLEAKTEVMTQYNFLIQLSSREGMAMSVAEAMQNGLVCIVTAVGEIPNYAQDMESAIFVDIWDKKQWGPSLEKIETVMIDSRLYEQISLTSQKTFKNAKTYSESLIEQLSSFTQK